MSDTTPVIDPEDEPITNPDESPERDDSEPTEG
jgi:hypothetical protein